MTILTSIFPGGFVASEPPPPLAPETQLRVAMGESGLTPPDEIIFDGRLHRFSTNGRPRDLSGWYVAHDGKIPAGAFGDWRMGMESTWRADIGRSLTPEEDMAHAARMREVRAMREKELAELREATAAKVEQIWHSAQLAHPDHPYLQRKGIAAHGAKVAGDGRLVVPLYDADGQISSLQYIGHDGGKLYQTGGQTGGRFWMVGGDSVSTGPVFIAEGFATAATIHEATGRPCVVAYSASNLPPVTGIMRERYGLAQELVIVADNDQSGTGQKYADQASAKYGARVVMPPVVGMDANDWAQAGNDLEGLLCPPSIESDAIAKLKVVFGDELPDEYHAPDELVENMMTIGSLTVVYGDSNSGKTFWALSVAAAISNGSECYGRRTDQGLVVYLASEAPGSIRSRIQALKKHHGCAFENLAIVPVPLNFYSSEQDAYDVVKMVQAVSDLKRMPVRMLVADTLARMSAGANENSGEDMGPVMARFDQIAQASKAALMIIHHNGKDSAKGARGWSGIRAHIDTEIEVIEKNGTRSATITKQRELPGKGDIIYFKLHVLEMGKTKFGQPATTCVALPDDSGAERDAEKKPSKHTEDVRTIEAAWWHTGADERDGMPFIARQPLIDFLVDQRGWNLRTAQNNMEPGRKDGLASTMMNAGFFRPTPGGWLYCDPVQSSVMLQKKHKEMIAK